MPYKQAPSPPTAEALFAGEGALGLLTASFALMSTAPVLIILAKEMLRRGHRMGWILGAQATLALTFAVLVLGISIGHEPGSWKRMLLSLGPGQRLLICLYLAAVALFMRIRYRAMFGLMEVALGGLTLWFAERLGEASGGAIAGLIGYAAAVYLIAEGAEGFWSHSPPAWRQALLRNFRIRDEDLSKND